MTTFFAQPYSIDATGFFFETAYEVQESAKANRDRFGQKVEEYEIQFIEGEALDAHLADAHDVNQANLSQVIDFIDMGELHEKVAYIIAVGECGYDSTCNISEIDLDVYEMDCLRELAEHFVEEGLLGQIPERLRAYLDMDLIARDLGFDYAKTEIAGRRYVYRVP